MKSSLENAFIKNTADFISIDINRATGFILFYYYNIPLLKVIKDMEGN
jgi:hypothetical protein